MGTRLCLYCNYHRSHISNDGCLKAGLPVPRGVGSITLGPTLSDGVL